MRSTAVVLFFIFVSVVTPISGVCERFTVEDPQDSVVGEIRYTRSRSDETLIDIAREFDLGYDQIVTANRGVNRWIPGDGAHVTLPSSYILPGATRRGLVLNIAELRLYYYPVPRKGFSQEVFTYPVSIGRMDWRTPLGVTRIIKKERDPVWRPPPSIRREHAQEGETLPEFIAGGAPDNPLGRFALRLGIPTYLIHGVDERKAFGIGMRVTHGCIRMYPEDIEQLFELASVQTPVLLVNEPIKIGTRGDRIYLSVHQPLDEGEDENVPPLPSVSLDEVMRHIRSQLGGDAKVDLTLVAKITEEGDGIPRDIAEQRIRSPRGQREETPEEDLPVTEAKKRIDREYQEALSVYLRGTPTPSWTPSVQGSSSMREAPRRAPVATTDREDEDLVRRYLEERY